MVAQSLRSEHRKGTPSLRALPSFGVRAGLPGEETCDARLQVERSGKIGAATGDLFEEGGEAASASG